MKKLASFFLIAIIFPVTIFAQQYVGTPCYYLDPDFVGPVPEEHIQACQDWLDQQNQGNNFGGNQVEPVNYDTNVNSCVYPPEGGSGTLKDLIQYVVCILQKSVVPLIFSLAMIVFLWGVVQYTVNGENEEKRNLGKQLMLWGIIGIAVMVSVWGLVAILGDTFDFNTSVIPQLPDN